MHCHPLFTRCSCQKMAISKNLKCWQMDGISESRNHRISDMLKTVYPAKTLFCRGYKNGLSVLAHPPRISRWLAKTESSYMDERQFQFQFLISDVVIDRKDKKKAIFLDVHQIIFYVIVYPEGSITGWIKYSILFYQWNNTWLKLEQLWWNF